MPKQPIKVFSAADIHRAVTMRDCVKTMRSAFRQLSEGLVNAPHRLVMRTSELDNLLLLMPAHAPEMQQASVKLVAITNDNAQRGLPLIQATVLLFDTESGVLRAIMDGETITAMRTGAASGAATEALAREDAKTVAIFGTGAQAEMQLAGVCAVRPIQQILVFGRDIDKTRSFAQKTSEKLGVTVTAARSPEHLSRADIICTATTATTPVFDDAHVKPGTHINGIGSYKPVMQEVPPETVQRAEVFVDQRAAALVEAGDLIIPLQSGLIDESHIRAEIGEVFAGSHGGRSSEDAVTLFKSVGHAAQDLALAARVWEAGERLNLGKTIEM